MFVKTGYYGIRAGSELHKISSEHVRQAYRMLESTENHVQIRAEMWNPKSTENSRVYYGKVKKFAEDTTRP